MRMTLVLLLTILIASHAAAFSQPDRSELLAFGKAELLHQLGAGPAPAAPAAARAVQRACFVTFFHKRQVVACFGSFTPRRPDLAEEIRENIRLALKNDPRAAKLSVGQALLYDLQITFAGQLERISDWRQIDPLHEGLFVERADGQGVAIVPGEARTASYAWRSALQRLGVTGNPDSVRSYRFKADLITTRSNNRP